MKYVIYSILHLGYFDGSYGIGQFRGINFATLYDSHEEANNTLYTDERIKNGVYQILELHIKRS